jgi:acyl-homoserine-lactone acylase
VNARARFARLLAFGLVQRSMPGEAARPLREQVEIRRDRFGVPHVFAESDEAAAFGLGYAQAEDHAEALARRYVSARGVGARTFGASEADDDFQLRRVDNLGSARRAAATEVSADYRKVIRAFAAGINLYVQQNRARLPEWIPEFDEADVLASGRSGAVTALAATAQRRALAQKYGGAAPAATREPSDDDGSNALAIGAARSRSGKPILLGNPHLRWSSLYWEAHVVVPGRLNFYGSTLVGIPWLRAGFNEHLGYVQTNNAPDLVDLYALPLDAASPDHYVFGGRSRPLLKQDVTIEVRQPDGSLKSESRSFWSSHLGPIVHRTADKAFAYRSVALESWRYFQGFYELTHARSLSEFRKLLARGHVPTSNFTYADAAGNVLYQWNARLPKRRDDGTSYTLDVPPDRGWRGFHALEELPGLLNPASGYVQNANNPPWYPTARGGPDAKRFPSYFEKGELSLRAQLALQMLEARESFTPDDVRELKFTTRLLSAERLKAPLVAAARAHAAPSSEELRRAADVLDAWDGRVSAESRGAVLFQRFFEIYQRKAKQPWATSWNEARPLETPNGLADPQQAALALAEAAGAVLKEHGALDVAWGDVNRYRFGDVDLPGEGAVGQLGAYRVQTFDAIPDVKQRAAGWGTDAAEPVGFGDAWVLLVHFTRPLQAWSVLAYGQTSDRSSPHSRDQIRLFAGRELRPVSFTEAEIEKNLERRYRP